MLVEPDIDWSPTARQLVSKALREPQPVPLRVADEVGAHGGTRAAVSPWKGAWRDLGMGGTRSRRTVVWCGRGEPGTARAWPQSVSRPAYAANCSTMPLGLPGGSPGKSRMHMNKDSGRDAYAWCFWAVLAISVRSRRRSTSRPRWR